MTWKKWCLAAASLATAAGAALGTSSSAAADQVQLKVLTLRLASDPNQVANVQYASLADGAQIIQYPWSGTANERWLATVEPDGYYRLASLASNKCLNVAGGGSADGTPVIQYTCSTNGSPNERWKFVQTGIGYQVVAKSSGKCLNVAGGVGVGNPLIQYTCTPGGGANDVWLPVWEPTNP
jgi:ricin-type beta-trefoil lectin protein